MSEEGSEQQFLTEIDKLIKAGHLRSKDVNLTNESLILVTESGRELVIKENPDKKVPVVTKNIFQPRVKHDLLLNDLRIRFEELNFLNKWTSEVSLKEVGFFLREFKDLPDAVCKKKNDKSYFLELEVSMKAPSIYKARIEEYLKILEKEEMIDAGIEGVIFFCTQEEVAEKIKEQIPEGVKGISVLLYSNYFKDTRTVQKPQTNEKAG
jgi:hypothetical protein